MIQLNPISRYELEFIISSYEKYKTTIEESLKNLIQKFASEKNSKQKIDAQMHHINSIKRSLPHVISNKALQAEQVYSEIKNKIFSKDNESFIKQFIDHFVKYNASLNEFHIKALTDTINLLEKSVNSTPPQSESEQFISQLNNKTQQDIRVLA